MSAQPPTEVCITIDTEFSIGGNLDDPKLSPIAEPIVLGAVDGKEHALGFLLDSFAEFGVRATFFVEALQTAYFGDEPMGRIARRIAGAGQDVQLHLHPGWLHYEAPRDSTHKGVPDDSCAGRSEAELDHFFRLGLSAFQRWGLPGPVAVRTGNFQVDSDFHRAAARSGILLSSSIALALYRPGDSELALMGGRHRIGPVLELPVLCYSYPLGLGRRLRPLSITACSGAEIRSVLRQAHDRGISPVIILTHPQEYIKRTDFRYAELRRNRVNQARLRKLLGFLRDRTDDFVTRPISALRGEAADAGDPRDPAISVSSTKALLRMLENGVNDRIWWY